MGKRYIPLGGLQREFDEATGDELRICDKEKADAFSLDVKRRTSGWARGQCLVTSAGQTLNTSDMAAGYTFSLYNNSAAPITLTQGSGVTLRWGASSGNRTVAARALVTIWCNSGTEAILIGAGVS